MFDDENPEHVLSAINYATSAFAYFLILDRQNLTSPPLFFASEYVSIRFNSKSKKEKNLFLKFYKKNIKMFPIFFLVFPT